MPVDFFPDFSLGRCDIDTDEKRARVVLKPRVESVGGGPWRFFDSLRRGTVAPSGMSLLSGSSVWGVEIKVDMGASS